MLPYLKSKQDSGNSGLIVKTRTPDNQSEDKDDPAAAHEACAQALIDAVQSGDAKSVADAFQDMFQLCENEPHSEAEHTEPHSYNSQNIKAGQE